MKLCKAKANVIIENTSWWTSQSTSGGND